MLTSDENANKKKAEADAARLMRTRGELGLEVCIIINCFMLLTV